MKAIRLIVTLILIGPALANGAVDAKAYKAMDKDDDGKVSHKEYVEYRMRFFVRQDKNKDRYLDASETNNVGFIKVADADGDGKVSFKEAVAQHFKAALRFDKDEDGFLSFEELNPE